MRCRANDADPPIENANPIAVRTFVDRQSRPLRHSALLHARGDRNARTSRGKVSHAQRIYASGITAPARIRRTPGASVGGKSVLSTTSPITWPIYRLRPGRPRDRRGALSQPRVSGMLGDRSHQWLHRPSPGRKFRMLPRRWVADPSDKAELEDLASAVESFAPSETQQRMGCGVSSLANRRSCRSSRSAARREFTRNRRW